MADTKTTGLTAYTNPDAVNDVIPIVDSANSQTKKISRNNLLGITSTPVGINDIQTLTNKTLTAPAINSPVLGGTISGTYTLAGTPTFPAAVVTLTGSQTLTNKVLTSPTISAPTITNASITADALTGFSSANTGTIYGIPVTASAISGSNLTNATVTPAKMADRNYQTDNSNVIANVTNGALKLQVGWGQFLGNNTGEVTDAVTFPVAFTTILGVLCAPLSAKSTTAATDITNLNAGILSATISVVAVSITTSGFTADVNRSASTFSNTFFYGYTWFAWGL